MIVYKYSTNYYGAELGYNTILEYYLSICNPHDKTKVESFNDWIRFHGGSSYRLDNDWFIKFEDESCVTMLKLRSGL